MRLWSVKVGELEVFTHLQGEALSQAKQKSTDNSGVWEVFTYEISDEKPRGELLALCLNHQNWDTENLWGTSRSLLSAFENGKKTPRSSGVS